MPWFFMWALSTSNLIEAFRIRSVVCVRLGHFLFRSSSSAWGNWSKHFICVSRSVNRRTI